MRRLTRWAGRWLGRTPAAATEERHYCHRYALALERLWDSGAFATDPLPRARYREGTSARRQARELH